MLGVMKLEKIGFNNSLKLNDIFDYEGESWLVRAIAKNRIKARYVNLGGKSGWQHDLIEAIVVAQKVGTFDENNKNPKETGITITFKTANVNNLSSHEKRQIVKVGDVCDMGNNAIYLATEVLEIKYSFIDVITKLKGVSVTELPLKDVKKIKNQHRLNELGWIVK